MAESIMTHMVAYYPNRERSIEAAKALVLEDKQRGELFLCVVSGHKKLDLKKIKALRGSRNVALAHPDDVLRATGCSVGTVPPFPRLMGLLGYCDEGVLANAYIVFSAASHYKSIRMKSADWLPIAGVSVHALAQD